MEMLLSYLQQTLRLKTFQVRLNYICQQVCEFLSYQLKEEDTHLYEYDAIIAYANDARVITILQFKALFSSQRFY